MGMKVFTFSWRWLVAVGAVRQLKVERSCETWWGGAGFTFTPVCQPPPLYSEGWLYNNNTP